MGASDSKIVVENRDSNDSNDSNDNDKKGVVAKKIEYELKDEYKTPSGWLCGLCDVDDVLYERTVLFRLSEMNYYLFSGGSDSSIGLDGGYLILSNRLHDSSLVKQLDKFYNQVKEYNGRNLCTTCTLRIVKYGIYLGEYGYMNNKHPTQEVDDFILQAIQTYNYLHSSDYKQPQYESTGSLMILPKQCKNTNPWKQAKWVHSKTRRKPRSINITELSNFVKIVRTYPEFKSEVIKAKQEEFKHLLNSNGEHTSESIGAFMNTLVGSALLTDKISITNLHLIANYPFQYPLAHPEKFII